MITQVISPILHQASTRKVGNVVNVERLKGFSERVPMWTEERLIKGGEKDGVLYLQGWEQWVASVTHVQSGFNVSAWGYH